MGLRQNSQTEIKTIILAALLLLILTIIFLFPYNSYSEGKYVHRGTYVLGINEVLREHHDLRERILDYLYDNTPILAEQEGECGSPGVTDHFISDFYHPELDGTLGDCSEILPDPGEGCEENEDPICPTCIDQCDPGDTIPDMDDVYNAVEIIGNESLITDFYKDVQAYQWKLGHGSKLADSG